MKLLDKYGIRATAAVNTAVCERYPFILAEAKKRDWEFIGHGTHASRMITSKLSEQEETTLIQHCIAALKTATGKKPYGWLGPALGESLHTPRLVAAAGFRYLCNWPNDDQPYPMTVPEGQLISLPYTIELDDLNLFWLRNQPVPVYPQMVRDAFDRLYQEGATSGRILSLGLHPWLMGQPYRIKYLDEALAHICKYQGVWKATGEEITRWYAEHYLKSS
jgi:peptidoglycan/xylan/chitin deacetylase (PgdA/CDA1 family)